MNTIYEIFLTSYAHRTQLMYADIPNIIYKLIYLLNHILHIFRIHCPTDILIRMTSSHKYVSQSVPLTDTEQLL